MEATTKQLEYKTELLKNSGLEVYNQYNTWFISEDNQRAYLTLPGIYISIKWSKKEISLNPKFCDSFVTEIQYDYKNPDKIDSIDFVKNGGTYGQHFFHKTIEKAMLHAEKYMNDDFEGCREFHSGKIISKTKLSRKEVAKKAFLHHFATFKNNIDKNDFRYTALIKDKTIYSEYLKLCSKYENKVRAERKYEAKLENSFKWNFSIKLNDCLESFKFRFDKFSKLTGIKTAGDMTKGQLKCIQTVNKYYSY